MDGSAVTSREPPRVLFLTPRPLSAQSGGAQVSRERLAALAAVSQVTVAHLGAEPLAGERPPDAGRHLEAGSLRGRTASGLLASYLRGLPLSVWRNSDPAYLRAVAALRSEPWDLVYVDHWLVWEAAKVIPAPRILHLHNAEPALFSRAAEGLRGPRSYLASIEAWRASAFLRGVMKDLDELHLLSDEDRRVLGDLGIRHPVTRVFLPAVSPSACEVPPFGGRSPHALFVGSLGWPPNEEGLAWYLAEVWPLRRQVAQLAIAGGGASPSLEAAGRRTPDVRWHGFVPDLEPLYSEARVLCAPLRSGSGIKIKIINALARGLPVVTTEVGREGMPERGGDGLFVADSAPAFAALVDRLTSDASAWTAASLAARSYAERHFSGASFAAFCRELADARSRGARA